MIKFPFSKKRKETEISEKIFETRTIEAKDIIAPSSISVNADSINLGKRFAKSFFIFSYPRYLSTAWFSPVINLDQPMDISFHIHPVETGTILKQLRKRVTEVQAEIMEREEKGLIRDPALETAYRDLEELRDRLQTAQERMFNFGLYLTVYGNTLKEIKEVETTLRSILEARLIYIKPALYQQREGFNSTSPYGLDQLVVHTPMNTDPLSSTFPFVSFDLSSNDGILYGVNRHNNSLILFDRFSLENANSVVFAKAGSGKSYAVKLEILRSLMVGVDIIILDPENEYKFLSDAVGGSFFNISLASANHINPFDLPTPREDEKPEDVLRSNIINLVGLLRIMLGGLNPEEDAIIDRALTETYASKDITAETDPGEWQEKIPLMSDFEQVLESMEGAESLVRRVRKFTKGTFAQFFNQPTNISMDKPFVVFGIRDMEDELRPIAMFIIMRYIWNKVRSELKKRILVVDEAWWIMRTEDGASFLFGMCKRARKYWLGVTTITQDVNDFMKSSYGQPIITNSSLQLLMKQSPATIDVVQKTFNLTEEEKYLLLEAEVGEGIFFAGQKHVAIKVMASYTEDQIITTAPEEVLKIRRAKGEL
ncbi:MAG: ATP-binding protein [Candidatus Pacebacteria bacterium]|nr:ATP-binding protein [Candidatus Paceibacterota bacterium]